MWRALNATRFVWYEQYSHENSCREHVPHTSVAALAFLIRHEVEHAIQAGGHPRDFRKPNGTTDVWLMEMHCDEMAAKFVNSLDWAVVLRDWLRLARDERTAVKCKRAPEKRVAAMHRRRLIQLAEWEGKLALATRLCDESPYRKAMLTMAKNKVRRYRRLLASAERRANPIAAAAVKGGGQ